MSFVDFQKLATSKFKFSMFMLAKLPSAWLCGVRLKHLDKNKAVVFVPYKWLSQNPFRSIYFACQSMAAEMSTGVLALGYTHKLTPGVSMLVTEVNGKFFKKAEDGVYFTCTDGARLEKAVQESMTTGDGVTVQCTSQGINGAGELVSEFAITWSFRRRKS